MLIGSGVRLRNGLRVTGSTATPGIVTDGLVLNLEATNSLSYPGTGTVWNDLSTGYNPALLVNNVTYNSADGGYLQMTAAQSAYVTCGDNAILNGNNQVTVEILTSVDTASAAYAGIMTKLTSGTYAGWAIQYISNTTDTVNCRFFGGADVGNELLFSIPRNTKVLISCTFSSSGLMKAYVNGVLAGQKQGVNSSLISGEQLTIGKLAYFNQYVTMKAYKARVYNRVLTEQEIQQNYNAGNTVYSRPSGAESWTVTRIPVSSLSSVQFRRLWYNANSNVVTALGYVSGPQAININTTDNGWFMNYQTLTGVPREYARAVGYDSSTGTHIGLPGVNIASNYFIKSTDGINWTSTQTLPSTSAWYSAAAGDGVYLAGFYGSNQITRSTDGGVTWQTFNATGMVGTDGMIYGDGVWIACFRTSDARRSTDNGNTWTVVNSGLSNTYYANYVNGVFAIGYFTNSTTGLRFSSDGGLTWETPTMPASAAWNPDSLCYLNGYWFISGNNGTTYYYAKSTDRVNWTLVTPPTNLNQAYMATTANGVIVLADPYNKGYAGTLILN